MSSLTNSMENLSYEKMEVGNDILPMEPSLLKAGSATQLKVTVPARIESDRQEQESELQPKDSISKPVSIAIAVIVTVCVFVAVTIPVVKFVILEPAAAKASTKSSLKNATDGDLVCRCQKVDYTSTTSSTITTSTTAITTTTEPYVNINHALHKMAYQSTTAGSIPGGPTEASRANDGNRDPVFSHYSCSQTMFQRETNPWWLVFLKSEVVVRRVVIQTRDDWNDCCGSLSMGLNISAGSSRWDLQHCNTFNGSAVGGQLINMTCAEAIPATYLRVQQNGENTILSLCEVEVYSY